MGTALSGNSVQEPRQISIQKRVVKSITKRRGVIRVNNFLFEVDNFDGEYDCFCKIFSVFVPLHIESNMFNAITTYYGYCKFFDTISDGELPPEYLVIVEKKDSGELNVSFKRRV